MAMATIAGMTFFFEATAPLSNWHPAKFSCEGVEFCNSEQYMMFKKAMLFGDQVIAEKIIQAKTPREHKALGRKVHNFDEQVWADNCDHYVYEGCLEKFRQNPSLARVLLETGTTELVEASPYDRIWGVGLSMTDPRIQDKSQWRGQNKLGKVLMQVRDTLAGEQLL